MFSPEASENSPGGTHENRACERGDPRLLIVFSIAPADLPNQGTAPSPLRFISLEAKQLFVSRRRHYFSSSSAGGTRRYRFTMIVPDSS